MSFFLDKIGVLGPRNVMNVLYKKSKRISKRGSVLKVRGGCYNYIFKLYK